ncbi:hypothetical protein J4G66_06565 [Aeromonas dhakensis]|uniref:hypothetical protein n=1 Tax=Aeromonas TaxID=642 RepID=UPI001117F911|nr:MULTISPECIES: hypothetical protein [Aeromonas]MBS4715635.1 hypothetical protein [Aeromonas dhakensis]
MRTPQYGLKINLYGLRGDEVKGEVCEVIRSINSRLQPRGFASNKGFTDLKFLNPFGFSWYLPCEEKRNIAKRKLTRILAPSVQRKMKVELLESITVKKRAFYKRVNRLHHGLRASGQ